MQLHVRALFTHDARGRICRVNEPEGAVAPRFFLGRTTSGNEWRFRNDLTDDVVGELEALCQREPPGVDTDPQQVATAAYTDILDRQAPVRAVWSGPSYQFGAHGRACGATVRVTRTNADLLQPHFAAWLEEVDYRQPFLAFINNGQAVSVCCSVRITREAHEAGVETAAEHRRRGYAVQLVPEWAETVRTLGCIPLYSTSWQNVASRALARALGLIQYGSVVHVT
jgi:GNAT superfamily N-acetyltransferase